MGAAWSVGQMALLALVLLGCLGAGFPSSSDESKRMAEDRLAEACLQGNLELAGELLAAVNPADMKEDVLVVAVRQGDYDLLDMLLEDGRAPPSKTDFKCLHKALSLGHVRLVKRLLRDPRTHVPEIINAICDKGDQHFAPKLIERLKAEGYLTHIYTGTSPRPSKRGPDLCTAIVEGEEASAPPDALSVSGYRRRLHSLSLSNL